MAYCDNISRQQAIDALKNDMASLDHIIKGMSANDVRLDAYVSQRNQVNYDIYTINNIPTAQPEQPIDADGTLWVTVPDIERVNRVIVDEDKSKFCRQFYMDAQPEPCEDVVSRKAVIDSVRQDCFAVFTADERECEIRDLPPVTPKQRTGKWILGDMCSVKGYWATCSACGHTSFGGGKFCRECGAKMGGSAE